MQFIRFADLKFWSQSVIDMSSSSGPHVGWLTVLMLVRHWCWKKVMVLLLYWDMVYQVPEALVTNIFVKTGLACSIGMCWLTVGLFWVSLEVN